MPPSIPPSIGRYEIRNILGIGGMATVYRAFDPQFQREVAIKVLPRDLLHREEFRARFQREARTIAALEHPAIVPVYDFGEADGQPFLVMRLMSGGALTDHLKRGALPLSEVARLFNHLAPALEYAHQKGVIHRDLKPGNILFDQHQAPYLADFGIARLRDATTTITGGGVIGTPAYMSPEQGKGLKNIDQRSDVYALGAMLYEMLTGRVPYESDTPTGQIVQHITEPIPDVRALRPDLPSDCQSIIAQAMAKQPHSRYSSVVDLASDVATVASGKPLVKVQRTLLPDDMPPSPSRPTPPPQNKPTPKPASPQPKPAGGFTKFPNWVYGLGILIIVAVLVVAFGFPAWFLPAPTLTPTLTFTLSPSPSLPATSSPLPATATPIPVTNAPFGSAEIAQVVGLVSVQQGTDPEQVGKVGMVFPAGEETHLISSDRVVLLLSDSSSLVLGESTSLWLRSVAGAVGLETTIHLESGVVLFGEGRLIATTDNPDLKAEVIDGWVGITYTPDLGQFSIDCLTGFCLIGDQPLAEGQHGGFENGVFGEILPVFYDPWSVLSGTDTTFATPTSALDTSATPEETSTPTPRPLFTALPATLTPTKKPTDKPNPPAETPKPPTDTPKPPTTVAPPPTDVPPPTTVAPPF